MVKKEYESYNFQKLLIQDLAEELFEIEEKLSKAYQERPGKFLDAISGLRVFHDKLQGMALGKFSEKDKKLIILSLKAAQLLYERNQLREGAEYLSIAYRKLARVIKNNNMMFPQTRKATSFKKWTESQL